MGYETKIVVVSYRKDDKMQRYKRKEDPIIDGDSLYYEYERDEKGDWIPLEGQFKTWCQKIGEIDMCKLGSGSSIHKLEPVQYDDDQAFFYYADDGNTEIFVDRYDEKLVPYSLEDVIAAIEKDIAETEGTVYRRLLWARGFLKTIHEQNKYAPYCENIAVLLFGH